MFISLNHLLRRTVPNNSETDKELSDYLRGKRVNNQESGFSLPPNISAKIWHLVQQRSSIAKFVDFRPLPRMSAVSFPEKWQWRAHYPYVQNDVEKNKSDLSSASDPEMGVIILESRHYQESIRNSVIEEIWDSLASKISSEIDKQALWGSDQYWQGILSDNFPNANSLRAAEVYDYLRSSIHLLPPQAKFYTTTATGQYLLRVLNGMSSSLFTNIFNVPICYFDYNFPYSQTTPCFTAAELPFVFSIVYDPDIQIRVTFENGFVSHIFRIKASGQYTDISRVKQYRIVP